MGSYVIGWDEIHSVLEDVLDELQGEVLKKDVVKSCEKLINEYKHFTDLETMKKD